MKTIPANLILDKNSLASTSPWILLLEIDIPSDPATILYLARNTEDVVFGGNTYLKFPFDIDISSKESSKGEIPSVSLKVSNVNRVVQVYLEDYDGLVGQDVKLVVVNADRLAEDYAQLTLNFTITACFTDANWANFTLGAPSPLLRRYPLYRFLANSCNWKAVFKGPECKYAGADVGCTGTYADCATKGNTKNYGGCIGLGRGNVRLA